MLMQPSNNELLFADLIPQAEIDFPVDTLKNRFLFVEDCDDLHEFTGAAFVMDKDLSFTIKHYKGSNSNSWTIYFHREENLKLISEYVHRILDDMQIPFSSLRWDRSLNPEL